MLVSNIFKGAERNSDLTQHRERVSSTVDHFSLEMHFFGQQIIANHVLFQLSYNNFQSLSRLEQSLESSNNFFLK